MKNWISLGCGTTMILASDTLVWSLRSQTSMIWFADFRPCATTISTLHFLYLSTFTRNRSGFYAILRPCEQKFRFEIPLKETTVLENPNNPGSIDHKGFDRKIVLLQ